MKDQPGKRVYLELLSQADAALNAQTGELRGLGFRIPAGTPGP